jgi:phytanoyl-CoA hydroxylase
MHSKDELLDIRIRFETQGFLHLRDVIPTDQVQRTLKAFDAASNLHARTWNQAEAGGSVPPYFDIPKILDFDDAFIDLVDFPTIFPLLVLLMGDDIQLNHTSARLFPPGPTYTSPFHSDLANIQGISLAHSPPFLVKVHFFIEDLSIDQGCLAFIPGSHHYPANYNGPKNLHSDAQSVVKVVPKAGDAVIFNTHTLHMALDNASQRVRKSIIYAYSHYWVKHYDSAVPSNVARFAHSAQRRQLFNVDDPGVSHFDRRLSLQQPKPRLDTLLSASRRLVQKALPKRRYV